MVRSTDAALGYLPASVLLNPLHMDRRTLLLAGAGLPFVASCASDITSLRDKPVELLATELKVCSSAYAVLRDGTPGKPVAVAGCADALPQADAVFQAASLTKPVVAFAALRLALAGRLDLQAPVSRYLPEGYRHFHSPLNRAPGDAHELVPASTLRRVSVAQLLNHSAGFPNWSSGALVLETEPGQKWGYSGEGFVLLQSVIESVTRMDLAAYMDQQVFQPLGMRDTSLVWRDDYEGRAVSGRTALGFQQRVRFRSALAAASMYTTAADYARFMAALLVDDPLVSLTLTDPVNVDGPLALQWGLGWGIERAPGGPYLWQWGNNPGFRAFAMASVASRDGFVVLTNSERGMALAASLAQRVLPAEHSAFRFSWVS
jgi:CubicO group peptidase (beta-lactamase class C family)